MRNLNQILFDNEARHLDRFGALLAVTCVAIVAQMLFDLDDATDSLSSTIGAAIVTTLVGLTLLLAERAAGVRHRWQLISDAFIAVGIAYLLLLVVLEIFAGKAALPSYATSAPPVVVVVLAVFAPIAVVWRLVQHRRVTTATLLGGVAGFLLIANAFNFAFRAVDSVSSSPFFGAEEPTTSFMYFSIVTITTLGYGDLSPATTWARLLSTTEAIIGQVYLVTVVAMIVGLFAQQHVKTVKDAADGQAGSEPEH